MTIDISQVNIDKYLVNASEKMIRSIELSSETGPSFLTVTGGLPDLQGVVYADDVLSGTVENEITSLEKQNTQLTNIINSNANKSSDIINSSSIFTAKTIEFISYESETEESNTITNTSNSGGDTDVTTSTSSTNSHINAKTNTSNLIKQIQYSDKYSTDIQKKILQDGIQILADWLDDYINNYDERVAEGKANGESEVKLSFLLRLRKSIENCDFPVGFGNDDYFTSSSGNGSIVLGAYSAAYNTYQYLNPEDHANDNVGALNQTNRSIILNAQVFVKNRKYTSELQVQKAIERGEFDYLFEADVTQAEINQAYADIVLASDEVYYSYASTYFASVLAHELIHSTHITNEAVTYNMCETLEDDFRDQLISTNWSAETQAAVDTLFTNLDLNSLTYADIFLPIGNGGGVSFHDLTAYDSATGDNVVNHGHNENMSYEDTTYSDGTIAYKGYKNFTTGNTLEDDRKELMNFVA